MKKSIQSLLSLLLSIVLIANLLPMRVALASTASGSGQNAVPAFEPVAPLSACWAQNTNGGTAWQVNDPNGRLSGGTGSLALRYNWYAYDGYDGQGRVLQLARDWENPNPNPVQTVASRSLKVEWYEYSAGVSGGILGSVVVNADAGHACASTVNQAASAHEAAFKQATPTPVTATGTSTLPANTCPLYPIALSTQSLVGLSIGSTLNVYNGTGSGNFGWLSWTGDPGEPTLVTSLTPPGNSNTYVNPANANDHILTVGKSVFGKPGVSNSSGVVRVDSNCELPLAGTKPDHSQIPGL